ncbi:MAG: ankyrin repeat domain-containing protein [Spirochaetales bacterium]|nr:ankyrin repeat domain-containing protein [Spirochaetales bacterium]
MARKSDEDKILDEIRERVIRESANLKEERERLEKEKVTLEALKELTDLPIDKIEAIADEVRKDFRKKEKRPSSGKVRPSGASVAPAIISFAVTAVVIGIVVFIVGGIAVSIIQYNIDKAETEKRLALEGQYRELVSAAETGNMETLEELVGRGIPVELEGYEGESALMAAAGGVNVRVVEFLLESGADVTKKNRDGKTALDIAEEGPNLRIRGELAGAMVKAAPAGSTIPLLWEKGFSYSQTAFDQRVEKRDLDAVRLFLRADRGAFSNNWDDGGIAEAASLGYSDMVELIAEEGKDLSPDSVNIALLRASETGSVPAIEVLLGHGAYIDFRMEGSATDPEDGFTPLMWALWEDNEALQYLLDKGADPDAMGSYHLVPPLFIPMDYVHNFRLTQRRVEQFRLLIAYGADINRKDYYGMTAIEYAWSVLRSDEAKPFVRVLKEAGVEIPFTPDSFIRLVFEGDLENVRDFLTRGFDPNLEGFERYDEEVNALIKAAMLGYTGMVKLLLEYGADIDYTTASKRNALFEAVKKENVAMVKLLLEHNAAVTQDMMNYVNKWGGYGSRVTIRSMLKNAKNK